MLEADAPCMQIKPVRDAVGQVLVPLVFAVAEDRMPDDRHVGAELMLAPGHWLERDERDLLPCPVHYRVVSDRRLSNVLLPRLRPAHAVRVRAACLHQGCIDLAL